MNNQYEMGVAEFEKWLKSAPIGAKVVYFHGSRLSLPSTGGKLRRVPVAEIAWEACCSGSVTLITGRTDELGNRPHFAVRVSPAYGKRNKPERWRVGTRIPVSAR